MTYSSSRDIINKVLTDFGIQSMDWVVDAVQWIAEGLDAIHSLQTYVIESEKVQVVDYKVVVPYNCIRVLAVLEDGRELAISSDGYTVSQNIIRFGFTDKEVELRYLAIPVEDGFPMYPDDFSTREALSWYIVYKLCIRGVGFPGKIDIKMYPLLS